MAEETGKIDNELLRIQADEYMKFIKELSSLTNIMSKKFYITVPFYIFEAPTKAGLLQSIKSAFGANMAAQEISDEKFNTYRNQLMQRAELVFGGLVGLGLRTKLIEREEILKLFYDLYNPAVREAEVKNK